jgi:hypothetical protein
MLPRQRAFGHIGQSPQKKWSLFGYKLISRFPLVLSKLTFNCRRKQTKAPDQSASIPLSKSQVVVFLWLFYVGVQVAIEDIHPAEINQTTKEKGALP